MSLIRTTFSLLMALSLITACTKDNATGLNGTNDQDSIPMVSPPIVLKDSLRAGWSRINASELPSSLLDVFFVNNTVGYVSSVRFVAKSTDGGLTWKKLSIPGELLGNFNNLYFTDADHGWVGSSSPDMILRTTDGGMTWKKTGAAINTFIDLQFLDQQRGYAVGGSGLWKTVDSGSTWQHVDLHKGPASGLYFTDSVTGWIGTAQKLIKLNTQTGSYATQFTSDLSEVFFYIQFTDALHGWAAGSKSFRKTVNGGQSWELVKTADGDKDIFFFDAMNGYLLEKDAIYKTTDGGVSFTLEVKTNNSNLLELHFTDKNHGWAVSGSSALYRFAQ